MVWYGNVNKRGLFSGLGPTAFVNLAEQICYTRVADQQAYLMTGDYIEYTDSNSAGDDGDREFPWLLD